MKIKNVTIQGFRGFNEECTIDLHKDLTLIYAPNSYGKTSISEAFEWLLYGKTYKVETADSKEEYKGSYRNSHLPKSMTPFVKVTLIYDGGSEIEFHGDLLEGEVIKRYVDAKEVKSWPLKQDLAKVPRPFILQHALKYLLMAKPDDRFKRFALLLGLERLDEFQRNVISVCTKPDACIPNEVNQLFSNIDNLKARLAIYPSLAKINKAFEKGFTGLVEAYKTVEAECKQRVPPETESTSILPQLLKIREDAVNKVFKGSIKLLDYSEDEKQSNSQDEEFFLNSITDPFIQKYTEILALATVQHILEKADFYDLGIKLLDQSSNMCPFCGQTLSGAVMEHISSVHSSLIAEKKRHEELQNKRTEIMRIIRELKSRLSVYYARNIDKSAELLSIVPNLEKLKSILVPKHQSHFDLVKAATSDIATPKDKMETSYSTVVEALNKVEISITQSKEDAALLKNLGVALTEYISKVHIYTQAISKKAPKILDANQILKHELDLLAGTEDISILVELLEKRHNIQKKYEMEDILDGLKELRRLVDQYVGGKVLEAISGDFSSEVMYWYGQIKTSGDPDVHFDGFDLERTKKGELKARRVQIKAKSYDKELVSAVSSLSESKLNALGLCVSIATNLKGGSPFDFLIIDDPIQSWDAEHEIQFVSIIRKLIECGKQVILMSHNSNWISMVCSGCRTINGRYYEITGYTESGPHINEISWINWEERLKEVDAIIKDPSASKVKLQQAEAEIRIVVAEVTCELYGKIRGILKKPSDLNSKKTRKMLVECGIDNKLVDRVIMTFETTDDAHHAPVNYEAHRQRIREYHSWAYELAHSLE